MTNQWLNFYCFKLYKYLIHNNIINGNKTLVNIIKFYLKEFNIDNLKQIFIQIIY